MLPFFDSKMYLLPASFSFDKMEGAKVLIVINGIENSANKTFIQAVFKAFKLEENTMQILFCTAAYPTINTLKKKYSVNTVIYFGVSPNLAGIQILERLYAPFSIIDVKVLFVESIEVYIEEKDRVEAATTKMPRPKARMLWESLKLFF